MNLKLVLMELKTIYSLIPCWEVVKCSEEDRKVCNAFQSHEQPCWTFTHPNTLCENRDCKECEVYTEYSQCGSIKDLIKKISGIVIMNSLSRRRFLKITGATFGAAVAAYFNKLGC